MSPRKIPSPHVVRHAVEGHPVPPTDANPSLNDDVINGPPIPPIYTNSDFGAQLEGDVNPDVDSPFAPPVDERNVVDMNEFPSLSVNEIQKLVDKDLRDYTNPGKDP